MGEHRRAGGSRGISRGLLVLVAMVVVIVVLGFLWAMLGDRITKQGQDAAQRCVEGDLTVTIISDPALAEPLRTVAADYNASTPINRDWCVSIDIRPSDAKVTLQGLTDSWDEASRGPYPAAWIPQSSVWSSQLSTSKPEIIDGTPQSLVTSPVVLAIPAAAKEAMTDNVGWIDLPTLQRSQDAMERLDLSGWGALKMAMPMGPQSDATVLAAQAIAMEVSRTPSGALTVEDATSPVVTSTLRAMQSEAPATDLGSAESGVQMIAQEANPATGAIHAVPITEQQLYMLTRDGANADVVSLVPSGPTPMADFPVISLTGEQVDVAQRDAVDEFINYVHSPEHLSAITGLGFRGAGALPPPSGAVDFPVTPSPMPPPPAEAQNAITETLTRRS